MSHFPPNSSNIFGQQQNQQQGQQGAPFGTPFGQQPLANPFSAPAPGANTAFNGGAAPPFGSAGAQAFGGFAPFGAPGAPSQQGGVFSTGTSPFGQAPSAGAQNPAPGSTPFGQSPFGQPAGATAPQFGQASSAPFGQTGAANTSFGQTAPANTSFGQNSVANPFGQSNTANPYGQGTLFGQNNATAFGQNNATAFGQNNATAFGQNNATAFGQNSASTAQTSVFGQNNAPSPFSQSASASEAAPAQGGSGSAVLNPPAASSLQPAQQAGTVSQPTGQNSAFSFTTGPSVFTAQTPAETAAKPSVFAGSAPSAFAENETTIDQSCLMSSIKDNSVNLYNLTLQEIIDMQASTLDRNIKEFRRDAQAVFEQDMRLIRAKNHYVELQKSMERENLRMDELSELIDYLEKHLDSLPVGDETEVGQCVGEFERIVDRFYDKVQRAKDEQGEVMDILNENYELVEAIDKKLDALEDFAILK